MGDGLLLPERADATGSEQSDDDAFRLASQITERGETTVTDEITQRYLGLVAGVHVGVYTGIRTVIDPYHLATWEEELAKRHEHVFHHSIAPEVQQIVTQAVNDASGRDTVYADAAYGDQAAFLLGAHIGQNHAEQSLHGHVAVYANAGVATLNDVSLSGALPQIATALDMAIAIYNLPVGVVIKETGRAVA